MSKTNKTATINVLPSNNEAWGFFGTIVTADKPRLPCWYAAFVQVAQATGETGEQVRIFLDSRYGRHFADSVVDQMNAPGATVDSAVAAAVAQWMGWKIGKATAREFGCKVGGVYLTEFVRAARG